MSDVRVPDLNRVIIAGRLTRDVELKHTSSGKPMAKFSVANSRRYKAQGASEYTEVSVFVECICWGVGAEYIAKLGKGRPVIVEGRLIQSEWEDKATGQKRSRIEIDAERVTPLDWEDKGGGAGSGDGSGGGAPSPLTRDTRDHQAVYAERPMAEDEIPF
jgi:single-strand DNA-binding protein